MMLDPLLTNVLRRRIGASFLDLGIVGLIGGVAAALRAEKFTPQTTDPSTGEIIWSSADNARLNELSGDTMNRMAQLGDTQYIWSRDELTIVALVVALAAALLFVLIPSVSQSTIGQRILHLRTSDLKGKPATTTQHFVRTAGGLFDLFPFVIPGLLGWLVAARSNEKQRIGDRIAKTTVIDAKGAVRLLSEQELGQRQESTRSSGSGDDSMIDLDDRLGTPDQPEHPAVDNAVAPVVSDSHSLDGINLGMGFDRDLNATAMLPGVEAVTPTSAPAPTTRNTDPSSSTHQSAIDHSWMTETPSRPDSPLSQSGWVPVTRDSEPSPPNPVPTVQNTPPSSAGFSDLEAAIANTSPDPSEGRIGSPDGIASNDHLATGIGVPTDERQGSSPMPDLQRNQLPAPQAQPRTQAKPVPEASSDPLPPPPLHRAASWQQPKAEPAPVWTPQIDDAGSAAFNERLPNATIPAAFEDPQGVGDLTDPAVPTTSGAATAAMDLAAARLTARTSIDEAVQPATTTASETGNAQVWPVATERIVEDSDPHALAVTVERAAEDPHLQAPLSETSTTVAESDPRWDDDWQAWIYWDTTHSAWLRHDVSSDSWVPLG